MHNGGGETREFTDLIALSSIVDGAAMLGLNRSLTQWGGETHLSSRDWSRGFDAGSQAHAPGPSVK